MDTPRIPTLWTYALSGLRYYWRSHAALLLGAAMASAVLTGALLVGDSVRHSLRQMAAQRLGKVHYALSSADRFFRDELGASLRSGWPGGVASGLRLSGVASLADGSARANDVQVLGVNGEFWRLVSPSGESWPTGTTDNVVAINERLANQLRVHAGDEIVLRVPKASPLSREAPIAPQEDASAALRVKVGNILASNQGGDFNLQASQIPPFNVFLPLATLQKQAEAAGQANLLLAGGVPGDPDAASGTNRLRQLQSLVAGRWTLADAQLELRAPATNRWAELRTSRVFMDEGMAQVAVKADPQAWGVVTYFVNELSAGGRTTPYSTVCAADGPWMPGDLKADEMLVNQWLAEDLQVKPGDTLAMKYFVVGNRRNLEEKSASFRVRAILPMEMPSADARLMPDFPGLSKAENCRDWDAGFAIQLDKIRPQDQAYWDRYRGTPKAFIRLAAGQRLWASRFGSLTAVRYPLASAEAVADRLRRDLDPAQFGLAFQPSRALALAASGQGQDFGQLFLGFSFFILAAALLLAVMLFHFGVEQRAPEIGLLLAVGFHPSRVRRLLLLEGAAVAALGSALGVALGNVYAEGMVRALTTIWREAVNTSALEFHGSFQTGAAGGLASFLICLATLWHAARRQVRHPAHWLLTAGREMADGLASMSGHSPAGSRTAAWTCSGAILIAVLAAVEGTLNSALAAPMFFLAGAGLLTAGLAGFAWLLRMASLRTRAPSWRALGWKNLARRRRRSLSVAAMLAMGTFIVIAVGVNRLDANRDANSRQSGTGGFALLGQSALPLVQDLNAAEGRDFLGLEAKEMADVRLVPLRLREGDDASCLNLNRAQRPRLLGVNPRELAERQAFAFATVPAGATPAEAWLALDREQPDGSIPAIGDAASIQWALGKSIGDLIAMEDENGRRFQLKLVGAVAHSILQGSLVISERSFLKLYPSETGSRWFLIDAPAGRSVAAAAHLSRVLRDYGFEAGSTVTRLAMLDAVQNTYIATFQVLGGLGLVIGCLGMGLVVARNVIERRSELALLHALGYRARQIRKLVMWEHAVLFSIGMAVGLGAALVSVAPNWSSGGGWEAYRTVFILAGVVLVSGFLWTWLAALLALRQEWLEVLRGE
jgi:putative ABC transport system permease protein